MSVRKKLIKNFFSLTALQGAGYLIPLITLPYLTRVLGIEGYGILIYAQTIVFYFAVFTEYGFNLTATKLISVRISQQKNISEIITGVFLLKLFFGLLSFILLLALLLIPKFQSYFWPVMAGYSLVISNILFPAWFYQGIQRMEAITILSVGSRVILLIPLFFFVKSPDDVNLAILIQSGSGIIAGIVSLLLMKRFWSFSFTLPSYQIIKELLSQGWYIFISQVSTSLFLNTNTLILGFYGSNVVVGIYGVADRLLRAIIGISIPISNTIFPHVNQLFLQSTNGALNFLRNVMIWGGLIMTIVSLCTFVFSSTIVYLVIGDYSDEISLILKILAILPLSIFLDNIFGTQILLSLNHEKVFMRSVLIAGIISLFLSIVLIPIYFHIGAAISFLTVELLLLFIFIIECRQLGISIYLKEYQLK